MTLVQALVQATHAFEQLAYWYAWRMDTIATNLRDHSLPASVQVALTELRHA